MCPQKLVQTAAWQQPLPPSNSLKMHKKPYSFKKRIYSLMYLLITLELLTLVLYSVYFGVVLRRRTFRELKQTLELYNAQMTQNLRSVDYFLMEINNYSSDITVVANQDSPEGYYTNIAHVRSLLDYNLRSFQQLEGMFAYFPKNDTWIPVGNYASNYQTFQHYLKDLLRDGSYVAASPNTSGLRWIPYEYDGSTYFMKVFVSGNSILGAWTNIDLLSSSLTNLSDLDAHILFFDSDGKVMLARSSSDAAERLTAAGISLPGDSYADYGWSKPIARFLDLVNGLGDSRMIPGEDSIADYPVLRIEGKRYLLITDDLDYADLTVAAFVPMQDISRSAAGTARAMVVILLVTLGAFMIISSQLNRFLSQTTDMLTSVTDAIAAGDTDERVDTEAVSAVEMVSIAKAYNNMADRIRDLRINVYEEQIQAKTFQLQFLRSQVAPHFLINCLNMIGYLADGSAGNIQIIRQMITTLSQHLRYSLSTNEKTALSTEIEYLRNYISLSELRFPGCIDSAIEIGDDAWNAMVFPLILIMFTENTFKYNLVMGEPLRLIVRAGVYELDGQKRLLLTHIDSGSGYPDDILRFASEGFPGDASADGAHIGLRNNYRRLQLYYGDTAQMRLSNEPGMGARIEMDIPYVEYHS